MLSRLEELLKRADEQQGHEQAGQMSAPPVSILRVSSTSVPAAPLSVSFAIPSVPEAPERKAQKILRRDSLRRRNFHGQPGSRRYQRWLNDQSMMRNYSWSETETEDSEVEDLSKQAVPTPLTHLAEDEELASLFRSCKEAKIFPARKKRAAKKTKEVLARDCFHHVDKEIRSMLRKYRTSSFVDSFVSNMDALLLGFIAGDTSVTSDSHYVFKDEKQITSVMSRSSKLKAYRNCAQFPSTSTSVSTSSSIPVKSSASQDVVVSSSLPTRVLSASPASPSLLSSSASSSSHSSDVDYDFCDSDPSPSIDVPSSSPPIAPAVPVSSSSTSVPSTAPASTTSPSSDEPAQPDAVIVLQLASSFHRLVTHGICQFYKLSAESEFLANSKEKVMFIRRSRNSRVPVDLNFSQFISSLNAAVAAAPTDGNESAYEREVFAVDL